MAKPGRLVAGLCAAAVLGAGAAQAESGAATAPPSSASLSLMSAAFAVTDLDRSLDFYVNGLGLTAARRIENRTNTEIPLLFPGGGASLLLIQAKSEPAPTDAPRIGRVILQVPDLQAVATRLEAAGHPLRTPIVEHAQHHVLVAVVADPDGNELELVQRPQ